MIKFLTFPNINRLNVNMGKLSPTVYDTVQRGEEKSEFLNIFGKLIFW